MEMWAEDGGGSEGRSVMGRIRIERKRHYPMRKQADFYLVSRYKRVYRTFIGGKTNECKSLHVHSPAVNARRLYMSIVKSAQLPNVGRCEGGLPMATFERLEPYVGKPTSTVLMGLGSGNGAWLPDHL